MTPPAIATSRWSTASFGDTADTFSRDLSALGEHLHLCRESRRWWVALQCAGETLSGFVAAHFVTTMVVIALLLGAGDLVR